eukprot:1089251-Prymnesium_polylepis.1
MQRVTRHPHRPSTARLAQRESAGRCLTVGHVLRLGGGGGCEMVFWPCNREPSASSAPSAT